MTEDTTTEQRKSPPHPLATAIPDATAIVVIAAFAILGMIEVGESLAWIFAVLLGRKVPIPERVAQRLGFGSGSGLVALLILPLALVSRRWT